MSKSCDGGSVVDGTSPKSARGPVERRVSVGDTETKKFPPDSILCGFVKIPLVYLDRTDITPHLNGSRKSCSQNSNSKIAKSILKNNNSHENKLSQKCVVNLTRHDLDKLKNSYSKSWQPWSEPLPDSEDSSSDSEMNYKCKICNKSYNSERKLLTHQRKKHIIYINSKPMKHVTFSEHIIIHEVKEYHKCRKCPKIFEDYKSLKHHTKQQHKKRKSYICDYCNKNFAERMIFKVHIKLHCDICGKLFPTKAKSIEHKRNICRTSKLHKCKACNASFYNAMDLKDHSYEHDSLCPVCDVCKQQFGTKCEMAHHFSFLHAKKHPHSMYSMLKMGNERLYLCNFCDESSIEKTMIERHAEQLPDLMNRTMTGHSDHYFCDVCKSMFTTEHEMLEHKWSHFLKTENSQTGPSISGPISLKTEDSQTQSVLVKPSIKTTYNVNEELPLHFQPKLVLERLNLNEGSMKPLEFIDINIDMSSSICPQNLKKAIVNPKSKKTLISKHQCEICGKYYSTNYCLNRHIATVHIDYENLRCRVCEETFVWPSLLKSHRCIRLCHQEMPFDDARPEIHFDNLHEQQYGFDDFNITDNDDYMSTIDFDIPAPIVELTEGETLLSINSNQNKVMNQVLQEKNCQLQSLGYKLVMHEVPIEF